MSEHLPDSPVVARPWCPGYEPLADPTMHILDIRPCDQHASSREGLDDGLATTGGYLSGGTEAGGDANRLWCKLLHRDTSPAAENHAA